MAVVTAGSFAGRDFAAAVGTAARGVARAAVGEIPGVGALTGAGAGLGIAAAADAVGYRLGADGAGAGIMSYCRTW